MSTILKFVMGSSGDSSVGIQGFEEHVTIIFEHDNQHLDRDEDTITFFKEMLAEFADGYCVTYEEWLKARIQDAIADDAEYRRWKEERNAKEQGNACT